MYLISYNINRKLKSLIIFLLLFMNFFFLVYDTYHNIIFIFVFFLYLQYYFSRMKDIRISKL